MRNFLIILVLAALTLTAKAEMQFPEYSNLTAEQQKTWGYVVNIHPASLHLVIPPRAAPYFLGARLYLRDKQKKTLAEINAGFMKGKDGSLSITIELTSIDAELIVYTEAIPGGEYFGDFGGFSFKLTTKP